MLRSNSIMSGSSALALFLAVCFFPLMQTVRAENNDNTSVYSPVVNGEALRGLSAVSSAESMGAGRITFSFMLPWYQQKVGYLNTPNVGANIFTGTGAFSYGVNSYVDLFGSIADSARVTMSTPIRATVWARFVQAPRAHFLSLICLCAYGRPNGYYLWHVPEPDQHVQVRRLQLFRDPDRL